MDGLDIFNVYVMGSIEMLTVFHFFTRFLKKKVKFIYYILFAIFGIAVIRIFTDGSIMELLVYVLLLMAGGFFICKTYNIFVGLYAVVMIEIMHLCYGISNSVSCILSPFLFLENPKAVSFFFMIISSIIALVTSVLCYQVINKYFLYDETVATVYKGNIIKNLIMDCQSYTKYRPNETTGGIFVSWRRKEELPTGA